MLIRNWFFYLSILLIIQSCGILGIHFKVHNPRKTGEVPAFSEESILLGELTELRNCFDVHYYDLSLSIDPDNQYLKGTVQIHAVALTEFDSLQIDLHPNFKINSLTDLSNNVQLKYLRKERAVFIENFQKKGNQFILEIEYSGKPPIAKKPPWKGGFVWEKDKQKNDWIGVACESEGASVWWPLKDHTSDEPDSVRMHYTVPKGLMAIGNGQYEGNEETSTETTFHWYVSYPINTYNITVYAGDFSKISSSYVGIEGEELELSYYVLPENLEKAKNHFKQVPDILGVFEQKFGPYPWYADGFKLVESPYAGMEHQTAIAYGNGYKNDLNANTDYILLHETAHEWWGNSVTASDLSDVWLQEGFATFAEALYLEQKEGLRAYNSHLNFYRLLIKNKYPVVGVEDRRWFHYRKGSDVYVKGAWVLQTLRDQLKNDSLFFDIIKSFHESFKHEIINSNDFVQLVNNKTGKDYTWFFNQYLYSNWVPELEYTYYDNETFYYKWSNINDDFDKLNITIQIGNVIRTITPSKEVQLLKLQNYDNQKTALSMMRESLYAITENKKLAEEYEVNRMREN